MTRGTYGSRAHFIVGPKPSRRERLRRRLHRRGFHQLCQPKAARVVVGRSFEPVYLTGTGPDGEEIKVDASVFGGEPVYGWEVRHR